MNKERNNSLPISEPILSPYFDRKKDEMKYDYVKDHRLHKTKNYKRIMGDQEF